MEEKSIVKLQSMVRGVMQRRRLALVNPKWYKLLLLKKFNNQGD